MPQMNQTPQGKGPGTGKLGPCGNGIKKNLGPGYGLGRKTGQGKQWTRRKRINRKP